MSKPCGQSCLALIAGLLVASMCYAADSPTAGEKSFDITSFGAVGDGRTMATAAIQKAIDTAAAETGRVVVPKGRFLSGPLKLRTDSHLHLEDGAVLAMSDQAADFPATNGNRPAFLSATEARNVRLTGNGTIDGQGAPWWAAFRKESAAQGPKGPRRPQLVVFDRCEGILIEGLHTLNPPNTHYSIRSSRDVVIRNIKANAPEDSPNTDALNLSGVRDVTISGCEISTGDDNIVLLCGAPKPGQEPLVQDVTIRDCKLGSGHGLSIGSYTSGGIRHVRVEHVEFAGTTSGLRMKSARGRGGVVEDITYRDIRMQGVRYPVYVTSYYPKAPARPSEDEASPSTRAIPIWRDIRIENLEATGCRNSIILWGLPDHPVEGFVFRNVRMGAESGAMVFHAKAIEFQDTTLTPAAGPPLVVHDAEVKGLTGQPLGANKPKIK